MRLLVCATQVEPTRLTQLLRAVFPAPGAVEQLQTVVLHATGDCTALAKALLEPFRADAAEFSTRETIPDWVVFTSPGGIGVVWRELRHMGLTPAHARLLKYAVVGDATAEALREQGLEPTYISGSVAPMAAADSGRTGQTGSGRVLGGARALAEGLAASGLTRNAVVHVVQSNRADSSVWARLQAQVKRLRRWVAYRSDLLPASDNPLTDAVRDKRFRAIAFTSGSTVEGLYSVLGGLPAAEISARLTGARLFSIGPTATKTLHAFGLTQVIEAPQATVPALVETIRANLPSA